MSAIQNCKPQSNILLTISSKFVSNAIELAPQMGISAVIGLGFNWCGLRVAGTTALDSAAFFGLLPAVRKATHQLFKMNIDESKKETRQMKAWIVIDENLADFCTAPITSLVYNLIMPSESQLDSSEVLKRQFDLVYYSALISGATMMINAASEVLTTAFEKPNEEPAAPAQQEARLVLKGTQQEMQQLKEILTTSQLEDISRALGIYKAGKQVAADKLS